VRVRPHRRFAAPVQEHVAADARHRPRAVHLGPRPIRRRRDGRLELVVAAHVEDLLFGGTATAVTGFEAFIPTRFSVGPTKICVFAFTGLSVRMVDGASTSAASIRVDQEAYVDTIEAIDIRPVRVGKPRSLFDAAELTSYSRATGALLRATGQTTPWLAGAVALPTRRFTRAVVAYLTLSNRVITAARRSHRARVCARVRLRHPSLESRLVED